MSHQRLTVEELGQIYASTSVNFGISTKGSVNILGNPSVKKFIKLYTWNNWEWKNVKLDTISIKTQQDQGRNGHFCMNPLTMRFIKTAFYSGTTTVYPLDVPIIREIFVQPK
ncbi:unnamed protein product [Cunninghamella echinulata]